jgi:protein dithiol:quinone oxidoreductase
VRSGLLSRWSGALAAALAVGAVAVAVSLQVFADMAPCAWCTLQRLQYLVVAALSLAGWLIQQRSARSRSQGFALLAARALYLLGLADALTGVSAALWQQFVASRSASCALTLADRIIKGLGLDESMALLFKATAFCDEANVPLLGIPFAVWSAVGFSVLAVLMLVSLNACKGRSRYPGSGF